MKVECEACGHLGAPAEILARPEGVVIVCAECRAESLMAAAGAAPPAPADPPLQSGAPVLAETDAADSEEVPDPPPAFDVPTAVQIVRQVQTEAPAADPVDSLVDAGIRVDPGDGPMRCPKCGFRQPLGTACVRCGLGGGALGGGVEGWRGDVPAGMEAAAEALDDRWAALCANGLEDAAEECEAFLALALAQGLVDRAARLVRLHAQDHHETPEGEAARAMLGRVIEKSHAVFLVSHGGGSRDVVVERTRKTMKALYIIVAIMSVAALGAIFFWFVRAA